MTYLVHPMDRLMIAYTHFLSVTPCDISLIRNLIRDGDM
jgi:hypothetical protein